MRTARRPARILALLGPTNTGKTHRAIQRMLQHPSGMFGLPLRLLAREVYEKVVAAKDVGQVALVTGEEKIVPEGARYFICTVEAMPLDRKVAFVAVDEVQLAGDRQRGHVFTDRILRARGLYETVFMGSDSMAPILTELVPNLEIERAQRFSTLTLAGPHRLARVPKRSAVVAFSADRVYELAERLKAVHGGAAVVLGALSPRTRNAQVALYQGGDVKHLVATDAIGMGLNLDLNHVTLAALRKYDGRGNRDLSAAEIAQIAGRAGRYKTPGTFGTLAPLEMPEDVSDAVESHRFPMVKRLFWRNSRLDFSSLDALRDSLDRRAPHRVLRQVKGEDDQYVLETLARDEELTRLLDGPDAVERFWGVCQVPDFRKTLTDSHVRLIRELAVHLLSGAGVLPEDWVDGRIARLDKTEGDIETLMSRIAWIRTWTYVTFRSDWSDDPLHWQQRTRAIEDRLSDALHEALTARFVEARQRFGIGLGDGPLRLGGEGEDPDAVFLGEHQVGTLRGFDFEPAGLIARDARQRVDTGLRAEVAARVAVLEEDSDTHLSIDPSHRVIWRGGALATLTAGPTLVEPNVSLHRLELLSGPDKNRVMARVERFVVGTIDRLLAQIRTANVPPGVVRGLLFRLEEGLGTTPRSPVHSEVSALEEADRKRLAQLGVRLGFHTLYVPRTLKPAMVRVRARLYSVFHGITPTLSAPDPSRTAVPVEHDPAFYDAIGFVVKGPLAVRADVLEACAATLRKIGKKGGFDIPDSLRSRLATDEQHVSGFVAAMGYREVEPGRFVRARSKRRRARRRRR